jgi:hypothetical protein
VCMNQLLKEAKLVQLGPDITDCRRCTISLNCPKGQEAKPTPSIQINRQFLMLPTSTEWWFRPVSNAARVGEQSAVVCIWL